MGRWVTVAPAEGFPWGSLKGAEWAVGRCSGNTARAGLAKRPPEKPFKLKKDAVRTFSDVYLAGEVQRLRLGGLLWLLQCLGGGMGNPAPVAGHGSS